MKRWIKDASCSRNKKPVQARLVLNGFLLINLVVAEPESGVSQEA
jgi:hypothetical protein